MRPRRFIVPSVNGEIGPVAMATCSANVNVGSSAMRQAVVLAARARYLPLRRAARGPWIAPCRTGPHGTIVAGLVVPAKADDIVKSTLSHSMAENCARQTSSRPKDATWDLVKCETALFRDGSSGAHVP